MGEPLLYRDESGTVFKVPVDQVETADRAGLVPASSADIAAADKRKAADSFGGQARAFGEGAAAGAFDAATAVPRVITAAGSAIAGTEDPLGWMNGRKFAEDIVAVGTELGGGKTAEAAGREYAENSRAAALANPGSAMAGNIVGQVGAIAATGGASLAGAGANLTRGAIGGIGGRLAGAAVAGAIEGAPLAYVAAQDQAYIEQRKLTGEQALAAMGTGALIGGGVGVAASGLGAALGYAKDKAVGALAARRAGADASAGELGAAAAGGEKSSLQRVLRTSDESINKVAADTLGEAPSPKFAESLREAVGGKNPGAVRAARYAAATDELTGNLSQVVKASNDIGDEVFTTAVKRAHVERNLARSGIDATEAIGATRAAARAIGDDLTEALTSYEGQAPQVLKGLRKQIAKQEAIIAAAEKPADAYIAMDQIRRDLLQSSKAFDVSAQRVADVDAQAGMRALAERVGKHYDSSWAFLMDEPTWGAQGAAQAKINQAAVDFIEAKKFAFGHFADKVGENYAGPGRFRPVFEVNDGKVAGLVRKFGTPDGAFAHRRFDQLMNAAEAFSSAVGEGVELPAAKKAALEALKASTGSARSTFGKVAETAGAMNQVEAFLAHTKEGSGLLGGGLAGSLVGGGPVGAMAGAALGAAVNPAKFLSQRLAVEQMAAKASTNIGKSLDRLFAGIEGAAAKIPKSDAAAAYPKATATALELFQGRHATPEIAYRERAKEVLEADANYGQRIRDNAGKVFGGIADMDPHSVGAAVVATTKAIQMLKERMPVGLVNPQSMTPHATKIQPSRADIQEYAQLWAAVSKPMSVIEDLHKGTVTHDQIDAIAQVYPALYQHVRTETMNRLMTLDQKGIEVPIRQRLILDSLLDLDGAGEPVFSSEFAQKYAAPMSDQAAMASEAQRPRPSGGATNAGKRLETQTDSMIGGK